MPETNAPKIVLADRVSFNGHEGEWFNFSFPEGVRKNFQLPAEAIHHLFAEQAEPSHIQIAFRDNVTYEGYTDGFFHFQYADRRLSFPYRLLRGVYQTNRSPMGPGLGIQKLHEKWEQLV